MKQLMILICAIGACLGAVENLRAEGDDSIKLHVFAAYAPGSTSSPNWGKYVENALGALMIGGACDNACVELSHKVCQCKPTESEQQACVQRVDNATEVTPVESTKDLERCEKLLDSCTCKKLADGDLEACGLARESAE